MTQTQFDAALRLRLMEAARRGASAYLHEYTESLSEIGPIATASELRAVRPLVAADAADAYNAVKVSLLYNDVTTLKLGSSGKAEISILNPEKVSGREGFKVTVPSNEHKILAAAKSGQVNCGVMLPGSEEDLQFYSDVAPLVGQGRLIISPSRMLIYFSGKMTPEGGRMWETHATNPLAPIDVWTSENTPTNERPVKTVTSQLLDSKVQAANVDASRQLVLPYIEHMSLAEYAKVLHDEADQLAALRVQLAAYLEQLKSGDAGIEQFRRDVLQPKIDQLERSFRKLTTASNIRVGGMAVGSALMCAATLASSGIAAAVAAAAGTAGLIGGAKELGDRYEKVSGLRDDPLHLLWRMKRTGKP